MPELYGRCRTVCPNNRKLDSHLFMFWTVKRFKNLDQNGQRNGVIVWLCSNLWDQLCPNLSKQKIHLYQANIDFDTRDSESFLFFFYQIKRNHFLNSTTGAQGCNFLTSFEQFWIVLNYFELYWTIFAKSILIYFGQYWSILVYLSLSLSIFVYLNVCLFILDYLGLSQSILVYLGLSHPISVYFRLSRLSQAFLAVSGYLSLTWPILAILYYLGLPWPIRGYIRLSQPTQPSQASFGYLGISWASVA